MRADKNASASARRLHILQIILSILLVVAVNALVAGLSRRYQLSMDLTFDSRYALTEENKAFLADLNKDVTVYVLAREADFQKASTYTAYAHTLLEQYPKYGRVSVEYVDFKRDPTFAAGYPELSLSENSLVVACENRSTSLNVSDLFEYSYSNAEEIQVTANGESKLASAISWVLKDVHAKATVITGFGAQKAEGLQSLLKANGFQVDEQSLAMGDIDGDTDLAILIAPTSDLSGGQVEALERFLENGGHYGKAFFYAADVTQPALDNLESYLSEWGVQVDDGAVFETSQNRTSQNQPFFATADIVNGELASEFKDADAPVIAPMSRPLTVRYAFQENYKTETILEFSQTSGVRPSDAKPGFKASDATRFGPIPALVMSSLNYPGEKASAVYVCSSASIVDSTILEGNAFLNKRFIASLFSRYLDGDNLSNFVGKRLTDPTVSIPTSVASLTGVLLGIVLPLAILALGLAIFAKRRRL